MNLLAPIDDFLNKITTYKIALYSLSFLWLVGFVLSLFGILAFSPLNLVVSFAVIFVSSIAVNYFFAQVLRAPHNIESTYITVFILALILGPENSFKGFLWLVGLSFLAMSSKYLVAINKKHIFNPAGFAIAFSALFLNYYASWWIGDLYMTPFVVIAGLLVVRKMQRFRLLAVFLLTYLIVSLVGVNLFSQNIALVIKSIFAYSPVLFFGMIMLPEPSTTPPKRAFRLVYGVLVAALQSPFAHFGSFYFSPETALMIGNLFSYIVSPKEKLILTLKKKTQVANNTLEFAFTTDKKLNFKPGQYLEYTLPHKNWDSRGMRRYFTIASSPTEDNLLLSSRFYDRPSSFKQAMKNLNLGGVLSASLLAGEFTLPEDKSKKLVFIAGGIGVTPFRSMVRYLIDKHETRNITLFYANKTPDDIAYKDIFSQGENEIGLKTVYAISDTTVKLENSAYYQGIIDEKLIKQETPDYKDRIFYISGPKGMIDSFKKTLKKMGISSSKIKTDFFPGFA